MGIGTRRRKTPMIVAVLVATLGTTSPSQAEEDTGAVPGSCRLHPSHVVTPGCAAALTSELRTPGISLPNVSPDVRNVEIMRRFVLDEATRTFVLGPPELAFDGWVRNIGDVPLELMADDPTNPTTVLQCVAWTSHVCREQRVVGGYAWHDEHKHFHFQDFANYQLRRLLADGRPDYSDAGLLAVSEKVSYCLVDSSLNSIDQPAPPFYLSCGSALQGVSPRWADVYGSATPGQSLVLDGLGDGQYALIVTMDYSDRLYETDDTDNVVEVTVEISAGLTQAAIVGKNHP